MPSKLDLLVVNPAAAHGIYGALGSELIAVEPPQWCRILASHARDCGKEAAILDAEALGLVGDEAAIQASLMIDDETLVCVAVYGHQPSASTQQMFGAREFLRAFRERSAARTIIVGGHPSALPFRTMTEEPVDYVGQGEGTRTVQGLLDRDPVEKIPGLWWRDGTAIRHGDPAPLAQDLEDIAGDDAWELLPMERYRAHNWQCLDDLTTRQPYASIFTSLGCPYKCLRGDTPVKTIYGDIPIKDLAETYGDGGVPVYTYDQKKRRAVIAQAINIRKFGHEELVRVGFDDGTYIDCTPDHQMMTFRWGNNKAGTIETPVEAMNLKPGMRLRAIREEIAGAGYISIACGRWWRRQRSRMIMEFALGRELRPEEQVHHKDKNRANDHPDNLQHFASVADHLRAHGEIARRMRDNNPAKNMTDEWRANIGRAVTGKVRTHKHRLRYRASKLGKKNPNYRHGKRTGYSRIPNHVVVSVTPLVNMRADVYCMEVPGYGWFFANNVLVKNCSFCCINAPFASNKYRMRTPELVVDEIESLARFQGVKTLKITDEMFVMNRGHYTAICEDLAARGLGSAMNIWAYARVDTVRRETLATLRKGGVRWLALGIESGSKHVRDGAQKALRQDDIVGVVRMIEDAGINVIGNFMFGLRDDDVSTMGRTLELAVDCQVDWANFYCTMAYPGSALYDQAMRERWKLPTSWRGYSQHNEDCRPLDTEHVSGAEVLAFRDRAFDLFFTGPEFLRRTEQKFGAEARAHVEQMTGYKLKRKLLGKG